MANYFRRVCQPLSFDFSKVSIKCLGSNPKGRRFTQIFGFTASITAFGYGVETIQEDKTRTTIESARTNLYHFPRRKHNKEAGLIHLEAFERRPQWNIPLLRQQSPWKGELFSQCVSKIAGFLHFWLTPVSCQDNADSGYCNCPNPSNINPGQYQSPNNLPKPSPPPPPPLARPPISNKPCRTGASLSSACAQPPASDIDLDAISKQLGGVKQVEWIADTDLSHCTLIRQASQIAVDSVTRIFTETASAYEDYHAEYRSILDSLIETLEESRKVCGTDLEVIECKIVLIKAKADEMKRRMRDLDMFIGSLEKLGYATAETAFMAHGEYASLAMSERILSFQTEVKRLRTETREKERDMLELESLIIIETGKSLK